MKLNQNYLYEFIHVTRRKLYPYIALDKDMVYSVVTINKLDKL